MELVRGGGKFLQYSLPPSSTFGNPQEWYFDDSLQLPEEPYCGKVVGDECYLVTKNYVLVVNLMTGVFTSYAHGISVYDNYINSRQYSKACCSVQEFLGCIFFIVPSANANGGFVFRINIQSKIITSLGIQNASSLVVDEALGCLYAVGGSSLGNGSYYREAVTSVPSGTSGWTTAWSSVKMITSLASNFTEIADKANHTPASYTYNDDGTYIHVCCLSAVGFKKDGVFYVAEYSRTNRSTTQYLYSKIYTFNGATINTHLTQTPSFILDTSLTGSVIGGIVFKGSFIAINEQKMFFWDPVTNTIYGALPPPPILIGTPNAVIAHDDQSELRVYKKEGIQRLFFQSPTVPESIAPVLKIYKGQKYHGNQSLDIKHDDAVVCTITEEWQTATEDIEIKRGQYDSAFDYRVYIENK